MSGFLWGLVGTIVGTISLAFLALSFKNPYGYARVQTVIQKIIIAAWFGYMAGLMGYILGISAALGVPLGNKAIQNVLRYSYDVLTWVPMIIGFCFLGLLWFLGALPGLLKDPNDKPH